VPASLAIVVYGLGIVGLFLLHRDTTSRTSAALWIPVAWLSIGASRSVGQWLGAAPAMRTPEQYLDGSPLDALIFVALEAAALLVLVARHPRSGAFLRANGPLLVFFLYCAASVVWSDYPLVAFKRWTKAAGNVVMVLVVLTDPDPRAAVRALLARTGFVLIPLSVLLIKYYPELGRGFDLWSGRAYNVGVGIDKNALGIICLIFGLGSLWRLFTALQSGEPRRVTRPLIAHGVVVAMAVWLLFRADSATSLGCFIIGGALLALIGWRGHALPAPIVHLLAVGIVFVSLFALFINTEAGLIQAMGRDSTLTTRTQLWEDLLRVPVDPLFGTGFESFWLGERATSLWAKRWWHPNQAHNGYLETYLNLGWLGLGFLGCVLVWGYRNIVDALQSDPELGSLRLAFFVIAVLFNLTEAAFKVIHPIWIVFILAVMAAPPPTPPAPVPSRRKGMSATSPTRSLVRTVASPVSTSTKEKS
jgi:exopolysaccharide production protein ExoQ